MVEVKINDGCIGCGVCASLNDKVFKMNDDNVAVVIKNEVQDNNNQLENISDSCPVGVIEVTKK